MIKENKPPITNQTTATPIIISQVLAGSRITNTKIIEKRIAITAIKKGHNRPECKYENYASQSDEWKKIHKSEIRYYKQQNDAKNKAVIPFNQDNAGLMAKAKILSTSKKDPGWYLNSCASFHMTPFMEVFTEVRPFDNDSADAITGQEVKPT